MSRSTSGSAAARASCAPTRAHPQELYLLARVIAALLGTAAIWLLYLVGARLFGRAVGLLAAAVEAVAFLPVFYSHLALNDAPTLAPLTLSLLGTRRRAAQRSRDRLPAGGRRAGARLRDEVHGRHRRAAAARRLRIRWRDAAPWARRDRVDDGRADGGAGARAFALCRRRRRGARRGMRARRIPDREPVLADRLLGLPSRTGPSVDACPRKRRASWARRARAASSTTCGRSPGGSAGCRRSRRSAARSSVWRSAGRAAGLAAGAGAGPVPDLHGRAGALLRALAAPDLPDPLPAGRAVRAAGGGRGADARGPAAGASRARGRGRCGMALGCSWRCSRCAARGRCTASTPGSCSRARTRATARASGWWRTFRR